MAVLVFFALLVVVAVIGEHVGPVRRRVDQVIEWVQR